MNETQLSALKADILADPVLAGWAVTGAMAQEIAAAYNVAAALAVALAVAVLTVVV